MSFELFGGNMKRVRSAFIAFVMSSISLAQAQTACPGGVAPGSPQCGPDSGTSRDNAPAQPPKFTGEWIKTWGAIAGSDSTGEVGTTVGKLSESDAKQAAIRQCALGGADDCKVDFVYRNQCAAFAISQSETFYQASPTEQRAVNLVTKACEESNGGVCKVRYSGCSDPVFKKY